LQKVSGVGLWGNGYAAQYATIIQLQTCAKVAAALLYVLAQDIANPTAAFGVSLA
jgi:hypothetical protein